ncbi:MULTISPECIES: septal ring lytic transglycosylase RlpA family protein [unclassified Duganella]|uniref:septal ring lytic transglycosylase RlpA family protein n=1 Tax=unclassified Duganella TaxID=2636909 RepID=UPI000E347CEF|nr:MULTISPECIES: septal ring lytic transglycosylase RlpA family protein [unclassified Duganella]RFP16148.1 septal ring lytic transglycosylase RlpA family protein [Duganella sp. BJB475]RFP32689.1 septal ring lytic transglycosylase RlpA family protein [Duganella sp. BJB476]
MKTLRKLLPVSVLWLLLAANVQAAPPAKQAHVEKEKAAKAAPSGHHLDRSGKTRKGKASYYGRRFHGKKMANGEPMKPDSNAAASKTLPVGTVAKVTNLDNNKSEVVVVKDRGPYVDGRIIDVTPKTADKLDMKEEGVAPVAVTPLKLPPKTEAASVPPEKSH